MVAARQQLSLVAIDWGKFASGQSERSVRSGESESGVFSRGGGNSVWEWWVDFELSINLKRTRVRERIMKRIEQKRMSE
jgi:hypothetical protein